MYAAQELFPAFMVGRGMLDGDPVGGMLAPVVFPLGLCPPALRAVAFWVGECLAGMVAAQAQVAVVEQNFDQVEVAEAAGDTCHAGRA